VPGPPAENLSRVPLFAELDAAELESIAGSMHEANVPAGAIVTAEGGPGDGFRESRSGRDADWPAPSFRLPEHKREELSCTLWLYG
jgi:hypothetical protein